MKLSHVLVLRAPRDRVYAALGDPEILRDSLPGCESIRPDGPDAFDARIKVGLASIKGRLLIQDRVPPEALTLRIEGRGLPGSLRSTARITLREVGGGTELRGEGEASIGGLIAALGSRALEEAARRSLEDFFVRFAARIER